MPTKVQLYDRETGEVHVRWAVDANEAVARDPARYSLTKPSVWPPAKAERTVERRAAATAREKGIPQEGGVPAQMDRSEWAPDPGAEQEPTDTVRIMGGMHGAVAVSKDGSEPEFAVAGPSTLENPTGVAHSTSMQHIEGPQGGAMPGVSDDDDVRMGDEFDGDDDLTAIDGIGPGIAAKLNERGVRTYRDLANLKQADIEAIESGPGMKGRVAKERWVEQARELAGDQD